MGIKPLKKLILAAITGKLVTTINTVRVLRVAEDENEVVTQWYEGKMKEKLQE